MTLVLRHIRHASALILNMHRSHHEETDDPVVEQEPIQALSARKLVLEAAKFKVLTAHSTEEALEHFQNFPKISLAVMAYEHPLNCPRIACAIKDANIAMTANAIRGTLTPNILADDTLRRLDPICVLPEFRNLHLNKGKR
jgi:hypothetical protein